MKKSDNQASTEPNNLFRVGAVSFFNTRPLIFGLDQNRQVSLKRAIPSQLGQMLDSNELDVALVPSIDFHKSGDRWVILPVAAIGSNGEVLTVRVFSRDPFDKITQISCDTDSHTSITLLQIIWKQKFNRLPKIVPLRKFNEPEQIAKNESAVLLIGDKVLPQLGQWHYELDLGQVWTELTSLPFVYAFWATRPQADTTVLTEILRKSYEQGMSHLDEIINKHGPEHGFDYEIGLKYFTENIIFDFGSAQKQSLELFYELAE